MDILGGAYQYHQVTHMLLASKTKCPVCVFALSSTYIPIKKSCRNNRIHANKAISSKNITLKILQTSKRSRGQFLFKQAYGTPFAKINSVRYHDKHLPKKRKSPQYPIWLCRQMKLK